MSNENKMIYVIHISHLTVTEVKEVGLELGLPKNLGYKTPSDGLSGKTMKDY